MLAFIFSILPYDKYSVTPLPQAKEVFEKICPDEEFLQPIPNPEDIILDDFLQDANQNATQPDIGVQADAVDPDSREESSGLAMAQEQAEGDDGTSSQPSEEEIPALAAEQEQAEGVDGASVHPSEEEIPALATEQEQVEGDDGASSHPSEVESPSGTGMEPSDTGA